MPNSTRTAPTLDEATVDDLLELLTRMQLRSARFLHLFTPEDEENFEDLTPDRRDAVERILGARAAVVEQTAELRRIVEMTRHGIGADELLPSIADAVMDVIELVDEIETAERWELRLAF